MCNNAIFAATTGVSFNERYKRRDGKDNVQLMHTLRNEHRVLDLAETYRTFRYFSLRQIGQKVLSKGVGLVRFIPIVSESL
jgi:hypothetical protein